MSLDLYGPPFFMALGIAAGSILVFLLPVFRRIPFRHRRLFGRPSRSLSRLGGAAMIIAFFVTLFLDRHLVISWEMWGLFCGAVIIFAFGLWDDVFGLSWRAQILFQLSTAIIVFLFGVRVTTIPNPLGEAWVLPFDTLVLPSFLLVFVWFLLVMNAVNWLDGLDGLSGGVSLVTLVTLFALSLRPEINQPPMAILCAAGAGAVVGFLLFNVFPARIMAGTTGSMFLGFLIAMLGILAGTKIATALLVLSLPVADALYVLYARWRDGVSVFRPDERHLHYKLRSLGWSEGRIALLFFGITTLIAFIALTTQAFGKFVAIVLVLVVLFAFIWYVDHCTQRIKIIPENR